MSNIYKYVLGIDRNWLYEYDDVNSYIIDESFDDLYDEIYNDIRKKCESFSSSEIEIVDCEHNIKFKDYDVILITFKLLQDVNIDLIKYFHNNVFKSLVNDNKILCFGKYELHIPLFKHDHDYYTGEGYLIEYENISKGE